MPTPFDLRLWFRTLALGSMLCAVAYGVENLTAEGPASRRVGILPLLPLVLALATAIVVSAARRSGELRALAALGASPLRAMAGALCAATMLSAASAAAIASGRSDIAGLFPAPVADDFRVDAAGRAASESRGIVIARDGFAQPTRIAERGGTSQPRPGEAPRGARMALAATIFLLGIALPAWLAMAAMSVTSVLLGVGLGTSLVAAFQLVAARKLPAVAILVPALLWCWAAHLARGRADVEPSIR